MAQSHNYILNLNPSNFEIFKVTKHSSQCLSHSLPESASILSFYGNLLSFVVEVKVIEVIVA